MASTKGYLDFVLEMLSELGDVSFRPMMGEYVLYFRGKVVGGVYDDRLLLKATPTALEIMRNSAFGERTETPYPGAKPMLAADVDDGELTRRVVAAIADELPDPKPRKGARK